MPDSALRSRNPDALAAELESLFGHDLADQPPVAMKQLRALRAFNAAGRFERLDGLPTLVVSAEHDPIAPPRFGRALAEVIPGARYEVILDASHGVTIQSPGRVNALLREHLEAAEVAWHKRPLSELGAT
jgi:pimeloyl-ACP methyl ester carboxylesterase